MRFMIVAGLLVLSSAAHAQTLTTVLKPDEPFRISFGHPRAFQEAFRWWCNGAILKNIPSTELVQSAERHTDGGWTFEVGVPGLKEGKHTCQISAYNSAGESKSEPITITVGPSIPPEIPPAPVRLRIVVVVEVK